jgi:hypothetical protein
MNQFIKLTFIGASLLMLGSCKKFVDVNTDPNNLTETKPEYVFTGALGTTYRNQVSGAVHIVPATWVGHYGHSTSFTGGGSEKTYEYTNADFNAFDGLFDNLNDYQFVIDNADAGKVGFWKDPANVMQCYVYQELVDLYGDVPYTEALQGKKNLAPKYTNQKTIYEDLVVRLDSAMARMARTTWPTDASITKQDVMFQGNKTNWIRFANTLKLRILMRQSFMPGRDAYIQTNINSTIASGYMTQNVLVSPGYQNIAGKLNPFYANYGYNELNVVQSNHQYRKMGAVLMNWLKTSEMRPSPPGAVTVPATAAADTFRLQGLAWPIGTAVIAPSSNLDNYVGIPLGQGSGFATASSSAIGPYMIMQGQGTRPGLLMLLAEVYFLQAEAAERYGITFGSTPKALYEAGILSHFRTIGGAMTNSAANMLGNSANAADPYAIRYYRRTLDTLNFSTHVIPPGYTGENIVWDLSPDHIKAILLQKWESFVHVNGLEAWSEYRKASGTPQVGVPQPVRTVAATTNPEPSRYLYPQTEEEANGANTPDNINRFTSKIFWDVN